MQFNYRTEQGFTLMETLITIVIVVIFFMPLATKMTSEVGTISQSKQKTQAIALARQVINQIKERAKKEVNGTTVFENNLKSLFNSDNWNGFQRNRSSVIWNEIEPPNDFSSNNDYTVKVNFLDVGNGSGNKKDLKRVRVRVEWQVKRNSSLVTETEELITLVARR